MDNVDDIAEKELMKAGIAPSAKARLIFILGWAAAMECIKQDMVCEHKAAIETMSLQRMWDAGKERHE